MSGTQSLRAGRALVCRALSQPTAAFLSGSCFVSPGSLDASPSQTGKNEGKGAKRKTSEEEKNGSEELVEKKVCKGFQTV